MVGCVVPGCNNRTVQWMARVPDDDQLRTSWQAAIFGGTGRWLLDSQLDGMHVCHYHFPAHQQPQRGQMYREPTLYLVGRCWREVSCCQLCLMYKPVELMFNRKYCLEQNYSLQSLAYKYFRVRQFIKSTTQESYFCEACVVQIDITHRFCEKINENARAYERMLRKMSKTMVVFDHYGSDNDSDDGDDSREADNDDQRGHSSRQGVKKKEPQDEKETSVSKIASGDLKSETVVDNGHSDCEIKENELETIELDDEDYEPAVKIKKEPDLEVTPAKIKQEDPDEDPAQQKLNLPAKVKEEPPEEAELPAKKQRVEPKYACLTCKESFKSQAELVEHMKYTVHVKVVEHKCVRCGFSVLSTEGKEAKCSNCDVINHDLDGTKNPKILNKQFTEKKSVFVKFRCGPCDRSFSTEISLKHHQRQLTCKKPKNSCTQCDEHFLIVEDLIAHVEVAHGSSRRVKECELCGEQIPVILFDLHKLLLCTDNLPKLNVTHLWQCALLFFRQKHPPSKAFDLLQNKFGERIHVTSSMVNAWYGKFVQGDFMVKDEVQDKIKELIDENATISLQELSKQVGVDLDTVQLRTGLNGLMQKYGRWVPQEMTASLLKNRFNFCRALLARYKANIALNDMILCSERWVYYGNGSNQSSNDTIDPTLKKVLLCVWWDQKGLIFHELLEPEQAAAPDRYQAQFSRFTKAMQTLRQMIPRQVSFQYGITDTAARQELKTILAGIGWELLRHPDHSPDIDPTDYHLFQSMQYGFQNLYFANPGQVYEWVAKICKEQTSIFFLRGIRMLLKRWQKVVENKGDYCGQ